MTSHRVPLAPLAIALPVLMALSASCGVSLRQVSPPFSPYPPPPPLLAGAPGVHLTDTDLDMPYRVLGSVSSHLYRSTEIDTYGAAELQHLACEMGGDAVIRVSKRPVPREVLAYRPGNLTRLGTQLETMYYLSGLVVAYDPPTPAAGSQLANLHRLNLPPCP